MGINRKLQNGDKKGVILGPCAEGQLRNPYKPSIMAVANIRFPIRILVFPPQPLKAWEFSGILKGRGFPGSPACY